jgi:hypothetical protein
MQWIRSSYSNNLHKPIITTGTGMNHRQYYGPYRKVAISSDCSLKHAEIGHMLVTNWSQVAEI